MDHACLPNTPTEEKQYHMNRSTNVSPTQQLNGTLFQMTSRRTQHEPTLTLQLTVSLVQMSSRCSNQIWVEHTKHHHRLQQTGCTPPFMQAQLSSHQTIIRSSRSQHFTFTWSPTLHLYVKSQLASQNPKSFIRLVAPLGLSTYLAQGIKPTVVHWNELHQAQSPVTESSAANLTSWGIWTSSLPSWRTTAFNLSLSPTWDSCSSPTFVVLFWFQ